MRAVTKQGPQPPSCVVEDCDRPPAPGDVMCAGHLRMAASQGGSLSMLTPPIVEPDDPELMAREAKKAAAQEAVEYAERRRVKTWKTLENGRRVPDEFWSDDELAAMEEEAERTARDLQVRIGGRERLTILPAGDPVKEAAKLFKRALRGRYGKAAETGAWAFVAMLEER